MNMLSLMYVSIGGAVGSLLRYLMLSVLGRFDTAGFPVGMFAINIVGSFLLGVWIAFVAYFMPARGRELHLLLAVGALGGFTTFSTFTMDLFLLAERGQWWLAGSYATGSVLLSLLAMVGGMFLVRLAF